MKLDSKNYWVLICLALLNDYDRLYKLQNYKKKKAYNLITFFRDFNQLPYKYTIFYLLLAFATHIKCLKMSKDIYFMLDCLINYLNV